VGNEIKRLVTLVIRERHREYSLYK
jgi:hypothetical protein